MIALCALLATNWSRLSLQASIVRSNRLFIQRSIGPIVSIIFSTSKSAPEICGQKWVKYFMGGATAGETSHSHVQNLHCDILTRILKKLRCALQSKKTPDVKFAWLLCISAKWTVGQTDFSQLVTFFHFLARQHSHKHHNFSWSF